MRRVVVTLLASFVVLLGLLGVTFLPAQLEVADLSDVDALPPASPPPGTAVYALTTATVDSNAMFAFRGGSPNDPRPFAMTAFLVEHPEGRLLIDAGTGEHGEAHFGAQSILMRSTSEYTPGRSPKAQLEAAGVPTSSIAIVPTHAHWDHISGVEDFPGSAVWMPGVEADFIASGDASAALAREVVDPKRIERYDFPDGPYLGYAKSRDVFGDGAVVLVPAPGHTPGSIVAFVATSNGRRYAFVGDVVWQRDGIELPAERPWLSRWLVDHDAAAVRSAIGHLAALARRFPELVIVPAHDPRSAGEVPPLSARSKG